MYSTVLAERSVEHSSLTTEGDDEFNRFFWKNCRCEDLSAGPEVHCNVLHSAAFDTL